MNKVIYSTDIGSDIDDAMSILASLNNKINLQGIYTVNGNVQARAYITKHLMDLADRKIDIGYGSSQALEGYPRPYSHLEECYINSSFIDRTESDKAVDVVLKKPNEIGIIENGVENLAKKLEKDKHTIFCIGPLTDIGLLIRQFPNSLRNIEKMYVMGGRFGKNGESDLEHNFRYDPVAANEVLNSNIPITIVPGDLCQTYRLPVSSLDRLESKAGEYVKRMAESFMGISASMIFHENIPHLNNRTLQEIITEIPLSPLAFNELDENERKILLINKSRFLNNLNDAYFAAFDPIQFWKQYNSLIKILRSPPGQFKQAGTIAGILEEAKPKSISISDVYIPYCFLHPNKLKTERAEVSCILPEGYSTIKSGTKHEIVTGIDVEHFKEFVSKSLK